MVQKAAGFCAVSFLLFLCFSLRLHLVSNAWMYIFKWQKDKYPQTQLYISGDYY